MFITILRSPNYKNRAAQYLKQTQIFLVSKEIKTRSSSSSIYKKTKILFVRRKLKVWSSFLLKFDVYLKTIFFSYRTKVRSLN